MKKLSCLGILVCFLCVFKLNAQNFLENGGFEVQNPPVQTTPPTFRIFPVSQLPSWNTTAGDKMVEVWSSGYSSSSGGPVYTISKPDGFYPNGGNYFAELNANEISTLYQTVTSPKTGAISYSFWTRGRNGVDTMALQIQEKIHGLWKEIYYQVFQTGQTWTQYTGKDIGIVQAGQELRFNYVSVKGSTTSIGNFLDNAAFGILVFPPTDSITPPPVDVPGIPTVPDPDPEITLDATEGLSFQAGVADELLAQSKQLGSMLYDRFALVRAQKQNPFQEALEPTSGSKEVVDPKNIASSGKRYSAPLNGNPVITEIDPLPWDFWGQGSGILSEIPSINSIPGQHNAGGAFLIGLDYYLTHDLTLGIYSGYLLNRQNFTGLGGGSAWSDGVAYGGYLSYSRPQGGFYADACIGGGGYQTQVSRPINFSGMNFGSASSSPTGNFFMIYTDTGYDLKRGAWTMGPVGMFQYTQLNSSSVQETDPYGLNLKANSQELYSLYSGLGAHVSYTLPLSRSVSLLPEIRCFWNHEFYNAPRSVTGSYQALPGPDYSYSDSLNTPNSFTPSVGITANIGKNFSASLFYSADLGNGLALQDITLSANMNF